MTANPFDWDEELPPETEEEVYRALLRSLRRKQGFGLFFVQCSRAQGETIVTQLRRDLTQQTIAELHLSEEVTTLYDQIADQWRSHPFDILVIDGLEASLYAYEDTKRLSGWSSSDIYTYSWKGVPKLLNHLNQQRDRFRDDFPARFVFLIPAFVVDYFIQRAADFFDWRSGLFCFPRNPSEIAKEADRLLAEVDYNNYLALTPSERTKKILEFKDLQATCSNPDRQAKLLFELGLLFVVGQDYENAFTSWKKALSLDLNSGEGWYIRGRLLDIIGQKQKAIENYDKALAIKPDYNAWHKRGDVLLRLGRYQEAIESYDKALIIKPDEYMVWHQRGNILLVLERNQEAVESYDKALAVKSDEYEIWYKRGITLSALGRNYEATESFGKTVAINPNHYEAWFYRGLSLANLGHRQEALRSYDKALAINPDSYEAWYYKGQELLALKRYQEAIESYDKALTIKSDEYAAWYQRGNVLLVLRRNQEAVESYDKALSINPDSYNAWCGRGNALNNLGHEQAAIESFDRAITLEPDNYGAWNGKGNALTDLGCYKEAFWSYGKALGLDAHIIHMLPAIQTASIQICLRIMKRLLLGRLGRWK
jgi:tetratricopeptide (TPR) repeat protein